MASLKGMSEDFPYSRVDNKVYSKKMQNKYGRFEPLPLKKGTMRFPKPEIIHGSNDNLDLNWFRSACNFIWLCDGYCLVWFLNDFSSTITSKVIDAYRNEESPILEHYVNFSAHLFAQKHLLVKTTTQIITMSQISENPSLTAEEVTAIVKNLNLFWQDSNGDNVYDDDKALFGYITRDAFLVFPEQTPKALPVTGDIVELVRLQASVPTHSSSTRYWFWTT